MSEKFGSFRDAPRRVEGNVVYLNPGRSRATEMDVFLDGLTSEKRTGLARLASSLSGQWPPARIHDKIRSLGFQGDEAGLAFRYLVGESYDPGPLAEREIRKRMARGFGERRIVMELSRAGFDPSLVEQNLRAVPPEDWMEILERLLEGEGLPVEPAMRKKTLESLQRKGFSMNQIALYVNSRRES